MSVVLDKTARRIIGVLIEKELTTPNLYPLTQNALVNGCNQKNNRSPVWLLQEFEVEGALRNLFVHEWVTNVSTAGSRVLKWKHRAHEKLNLDEEELPIMAELLLRGAQTLGELRSRTARMKKFESLESLGQKVEELRTRGLIRLAAPIPGRRAQLFDHTLYLDDEVVDAPVAAEQPLSTAPASPPTTSSPDKIQRLEEEIENLKKRLRRIESELGLEEIEGQD